MSDSLPPTPFDDLEAGAVLRPQDIAERMRVDVRSVRRAITAGELPASRACGVRVLAADAANWWRQGAVRAGAAPVRPEPTTRSAPSKRSGRFDRSAAHLPLPPRGGSR